MLGRHFEHVLWSDEFYNAMEDVDFIFILQKPTNMIGHLGGGSFWVCSRVPSSSIFDLQKDNIENVVKNDHVDVLITNMKTKGFFHANHCDSIKSEDMQVRWLKMTFY